MSSGTRRGSSRLSLRRGSQSRVRHVDRGHVLVLATAAALLLLHLSAWPAALLVQDESLYLSSAYLLTQGTLYADELGVSLLAAVPADGHALPQYPPGLAALLVPLVLVDWRLAFVVPLVSHLLGTALFAVLLRRTGARPAWAVLFLLYPPLLLFSRTLMSDVPAVAATVGAFVLLLQGRRGHFLCGLVLGLSLFLRYANIFTAAFIVLASLLGSLYARRDGEEKPYRVVPLVAGLLPGLLLFVGYHLVVFGTPLPTGSAELPLFSLHYAWKHFPEYALALALVYPLMLFAPLAYRGPLRREVLTVCYGVLFLFSVYFSRDRAPGVQGIVIGLRLLLPAIPLYLLAYAHALDGLLDRLERSARGRAARPTRLAYYAVPVVAAILGLVGAAALIDRHDARLDESAQLRKALGEVIASSPLIAVNGESVKFVNPVWGSPPYVIYGSQATGAPGFPEPARATAVVFAAPVATLQSGGEEGAGRLGVDLNQDLEQAERLAHELRLRLAWRSCGHWQAAVWTREDPAGSSSSYQHADAACW